METTCQTVDGHWKKRKKGTWSRLGGVATAALPQAGAVRISAPKADRKTGAPPGETLLYVSPGAAKNEVNSGFRPGLLALISGPGVPRNSVDLESLRAVFPGLGVVC